MPEELLENPETSKALKEVEESAYTEQEMDAYEDFWDKLGAERLLFVDSNSISREEGRAEGREEGRKEGLEVGRKEGLEAGRKEGLEAGRKAGLEAGRKEERTEMARKMLAMGMDRTTVSQLTGLSGKELENM